LSWIKVDRPRMPAHCGHARAALARRATARIPAASPAPRRTGLDGADVITDPVFYLLALPAVTVLGLGKGGFAGIGMAATPLMALHFPPLQAAAIMLPLILCQDVISVWVYRKDWDRWNVAVLSAGGVIGLGVAWVFAAHVSDDAIRLSVGVIGVGFVLTRWLSRGPRATARPTVAAGMFWGALSAFTSTLIQAGAPPFQAFVLPQRLPKMTLVGTTAIFFATVNVMKIAPYVGLQQFSAETFKASAVLLPAAIAANFLGIWLVRVTPQELFYRIAYWLVLVLSVALLWQGSAAFF
jgi:uncharacterized membrane protein YfcA